jgi:hypothetical protein
MLFDTHSRGGLDVTLAINLFFKGVLLFPIFLFAGYVGIAMMKHMIFHGIPVMNSVTEEQQEILRNRDSNIGLPPTMSPREISELPPRPVMEAPGPVDPSAIELLSPAPIMPKDDITLRGDSRRWMRSNCDLEANVNGSYYVCRGH